MEFTAAQIAQFVQGRVEGDENATVNTFAKIEEGKEGAISFLSNPKYTHFVYDTKSSIVLIDENVELDHPVSTTLIRVKNAYECVAKLLQMYESMKPKKTGIDPLAFVSPKAKVAENVYIGAFAYISDGAEVGEGSQIYPHAYIGEGVKIGKNALIYPHVTIYHGCKLGDNVTLHAGCVIGADGFGFAPGPDGYDKIPQIGIVTIEDDVEIGANTCGRNKPGWDFLYSMSKHYPNLNIEWLLNGTGKMYKSMNVPAPEPVRQEETLPPDLFSQLEPPAAEVKPQVTPRESEIRTESVRALADTLPTKGNDSPSEPMQVIDNKRKIAKIVVFYDDNTFIEIK